MSDLLSTVPAITRTGRPAHQQIQRWLATAIQTGQLGRGERLPSERVVAQALGVSRMTLRQALAELERRGIIARESTASGAPFIARGAVDVDLTELVGLSEQIMRVDQRAGARVQSARTIPAEPDVSHALWLGAGGLVHEIVRVRLADDIPVAVEHSFFPAERFADLLSHDLDGSMYGLLREKYGAAPTLAAEELSPGVATSAESGLLGVARRSPVLRIERTAFTPDQQPVEFSRDVFRPDRVRLLVRSSLRLGTGILQAGREPAQPTGPIFADSAVNGSNDSKRESSRSMT